MNIISSDIVNIVVVTKPPLVFEDDFNAAFCTSVKDSINVLGNVCLIYKAVVKKYAQNTTVLAFTNIKYLESVLTYIIILFRFLFLFY